MKAEYDFSKGEQGKFYQRDAEFWLPMYVESVWQFIKSTLGLIFEQFERNNMPPGKSTR